MRLGVDVGAVRVGVAVSDPDGRVAVPLRTVARPRRAPGSQRPDLDEIAALVREREAVEVIVGLPRTLSGREGQAAQAAREYALALADRIHPVPVRLVDERLTTVSATRSLRAAGVDSRRGRSVVDQAAATVILQAALDAPETTTPLAPETTTPLAPETTTPLAPETTTPLAPETTTPLAPETTPRTPPEGAT